MELKREIDLMETRHRIEKREFILKQFKLFVADMNVTDLMSAMIRLSNKADDHNTSIDFDVLFDADIQMLELVDAFIGEDNL